jgi:hypothetical protein
MGWKSAWSTMLSSWEVSFVGSEGFVLVGSVEVVVITMLKVRCRTDVNEMLSMLLKGK